MTEIAGRVICRRGDEAVLCCPKNRTDQRLRRERGGWGEIWYDLRLPTHLLLGILAGPIAINNRAMVFAGGEADSEAGPIRGGDFETLKFAERVDRKRGRSLLPGRRAGGSLSRSRC